MGITVGSGAASNDDSQVSNEELVETYESSTPAPEPSIEVGEPAEAPGSAGLLDGVVEADPDVAELDSEVAKGTQRTKNGAVAAFTSYSVWLIASPAAASDPSAALEALGGDVLNPTDARQLTDLDRSGSNGFDVAKGAYRVVAHSGDETSPDQVMVEIAAPLTIDGATRWAVVGGVVQWVEGAWELSSIAPREVPQPTSGPSVSDFSDADRNLTLAGLGWATFEVAG